MIDKALTTGCTLLAVILSSLGMDWIELGQGLHPAVAFPLATLAFFLPYTYEVYDDE